MRSLSLLALLVVLLGPGARGGGWSSGGGGLLKDAVNPWFLNNTKTVRYCIAIDENNFGVSVAAARTQLLKAIQFWKDDFQSAMMQTLPRFGPVKIATQDFAEVACDQAPEIEFLFGILNQEQKVFLRDPAEFAAVAVRTHYDRVQLRARGFVYVSPVTGPLAYNPEGVIEAAWSHQDGQLLYLTLVHELGHVFGVSHRGSLGDLMAEGFVEGVLSSAKLFPTVNVSYSGFFALPQSTQMICPDKLLLDKWKLFFDVNGDETCFQFQFLHKAGKELFGETKMKVLVARSNMEVGREVREISLKIARFFPKFRSHIYLTKEQQVFAQSELPVELKGLILGATGVEVGKEGEFVLSDGKTRRSVKVRFEQGSVITSIDGVLDGRIVTLL